MADWTKPMQQTYEYYIVDPNTWKDMTPIKTVKSATISRDSEADTLGSATIDIVDSVGECYIRIYLVTIQNGVTEKHPLGTFLVQTPSSSYDGKTRNVSMDAYTPLLELKEKQPDIGYYVPKTVYYRVELNSDGEYVKLEEEMELPSGEPKDNAVTTTGEQVFEQTDKNGTVTARYCIPDTVMSLAYRLLRTHNQLITTYYEVKETDDGYVKTDKVIEFPSGELLENSVTTTGEQVYTQIVSDEVQHYCSVETVRVTRLTRAPVIEVECFNPLHYDFVADTDDTWFSFIKDLIANANYEFALDELGRVLFAPITDTKSLQPVWTYTDDNSSILYPEITMNHDLYGIPNVVEVIYSNGDDKIYATVKNEDINSPTSIQNRGREITYRVTNPEIGGVPTYAKVKDCAKRILEELSTIEYTISYSHGYCPVRLGDCVRLNYERAGIKNIKAKVISQSISCEPGCKVTEKAVFTTKLWR